MPQVSFVTGITDTGGKFAAGIVDNGGIATGINTPEELVAKFAASAVVVDTGGMPPVSLIPVVLVNIFANFPKNLK